jgi:hypothetical protein
MTSGSLVLRSVRPLRNIAADSPSRASSSSDATPLYSGFHNVSHDTLAASTRSARKPMPVLKTVYGTVYVPPSS